MNSVIAFIVVLGIEELRDPIDKIIPDTLLYSYEVDPYFSPPENILNTATEINIRFDSIKAFYSKASLSNRYEIDFEIVTFNKNVPQVYLTDPFLINPEVTNRLKKFNGSRSIFVSIKRIHGVLLPSYYFATFYQLAFKRTENSFQKNIDSILKKLISENHLQNVAIQELRSGTKELVSIIEYWESEKISTPLEPAIVDLIRGRIKLLKQVLHTRTHNLSIFYFMLEMIDSFQFEFEIGTLLNSRLKNLNHACFFCKKSYLVKEINNGKCCSYEDRFYIYLPKYNESLLKYSASLCKHNVKATHYKKSSSPYLFFNEQHEDTLQPLKPTICSSSDSLFTPMDLDIEEFNSEVAQIPTVEFGSNTLKEFLLKKTSTASKRQEPTLSTVNASFVSDTLNQILYSDLFIKEFPDSFFNSSLSEMLHSIKHASTAPDGNIIVRANKNILSFLLPKTLRRSSAINEPNFWVVEFHKNKLFPKKLLNQLTEIYSKDEHMQASIYYTFNQILERSDCEKSNQNRAHYKNLLETQSIG